MSFAARVASLPPILIFSVWAASLAATTVKTLPLLYLGWPLIWYFWTPCVYAALREATIAPPQKRYPPFAISMFSLGIVGFFAVQITARLAAPIGPHTLPPPTTWIAAAAFAIGTLASFWLTADALVKAETGRSYLANPRSVSSDYWQFVAPGIGVWFLHPRIKRVLETD